MRRSVGLGNTLLVRALAAVAAIGKAHTTSSQIEAYGEGKISMRELRPNSQLDMPGDSPLDAAIDRTTRVCLRLAAVVLIALLGIRIIGQNPFQPQTAYAATYSPYTANMSEMGYLVGTYDDMPEVLDTWCGVSVATTIIGYAYWQAGISNNPYSTQQDVAALMRSSSAQSPWGHANGTYTFLANISLDKGTDPRALAWAQYTATPYGYYYHNYIYPGGNGVLNATRNFASDYGSRGTNVPISVTINGGAHTVMVGGVYANEDPSTNYSTVQFSYILVYDPWYGSNFSPINYYNISGVAMWQSYSDWTSMSKWWGRTYNTHNGFDPDPNTTPGNYYNVPPLSTHWGGNYVTIEQDNIPPSTYSENIALNNVGSPVPHN